MKQRKPKAEFWETKNFKELQSLWDDILKDSGFIDIEENVGKDKELKQNSSNVYRSSSSIECEAKLQYHRLLSECAQKTEFDDEIDRFIMLKRAEGLKICEISDELKKIKQKNHRQTIRYIIRKWEKEWGIRAWTIEQLNPPWRSPRIR